MAWTQSTAVENIRVLVMETQLWPMHIQKLFQINLKSPQKTITTK